MCLGGEGGEERLGHLHYKASLQNTETGRGQKVKNALIRVSGQVAEKRESMRTGACFCCQNVSEFYQRCSNNIIHEVKCSLSAPAVIESLPCSPSAHPCSSLESEHAVYLPLTNFPVSVQREQSKEELSIT